MRKQPRWFFDVISLRDSAVLHAFIAEVQKRANRKRKAPLSERDVGKDVVYTELMGLIREVRKGLSK